MHRSLTHSDPFATNVVKHLAVGHRFDLPPEADIVWGRLPLLIASVKPNSRLTMSLYSSSLAQSVGPFIIGHARPPGTAPPRADRIPKLPAIAIYDLSYLFSNDVWRCRLVK